AHSPLPIACADSTGHRQSAARGTRGGSRSATPPGSSGSSPAGKPADRAPERLWNPGPLRNQRSPRSAVLASSCVGGSARAVAPFLRGRGGRSAPGWVGGGDAAGSFLRLGATTPASAFGEVRAVAPGRRALRRGRGRREFARGPAVGA